jgi:hypothetical protein
LHGGGWFCDFGLRHGRQRSAQRHGGRTFLRGESQGSGTNNPEAQIVVPIRRVVVVPVRRAQVLRVIVPTPAAFNAVRACFSRTLHTHKDFLKRNVLAISMHAKTLRARSAAFSSVVLSSKSEAQISYIFLRTLLFDFCKR